MGDISVSVEVEVPSILVYSFLKDSYLDSRQLDSQKQLKGYIPNTQLKEDQPKRKLTFYVAGRDATGIKTTGWEWSYFLEEQGPQKTRITIAYSWGIGVGFLGLGTIKAQAANGAGETVRALIALETGYKASKI